MKAHPGGWYSATVVMASLLVAGCSSERPARSPSAHFESNVEPARAVEPAAPDRPFASTEPAAEPAAPERVAEVDSDARLAHEACACISRTGTVRAVPIRAGVRLVFRPYDRSDLERLERKVKALEDAAATAECELPGLLSSADDVDVDVVDGAVQVDVETESARRPALRARAREFAAQVASYGVVSPPIATERSARGRR